jgi:hypothetical protein
MNATLLLAAFVAVLAIAWMAMRGEQDASLRWPEASGTVLAVEAAPAVGRGAGRRERLDAWQPLVVYDYEVHGRRYTSERIKLDPSYARMGRAEVEEFLQHYRPGTPIRVRYDPKQPGRAILVPGRG